MLSWSEAFPLMARSTMLSVVGVGVAVFALWLAALFFLDENRRVFLWGLFAAIAAYLIQLVIPFPLVFFGLQLPLLLAVMVAPLVEECVRITAATLLSMFAGPRFWEAGLWYATGYASLEATAKLLDAMVFVSRGHFARWDYVLAELSVPPVVLLLHMTLGLVAACLFAARWRPLIIIAVTFAIHFAHNASVVWGIRATDFTTIVLINCIRVAIFVFIISRCAFFLRGMDERYRALQ